MEVRDMPKDKFLFIYLTLLIIILEMSFIGLHFAKSFYYLIPISIVTIGITLIIYNIYKLNISHKTQVHHQIYNLYFDEYDELYHKTRNRF